VLRCAGQCFSLLSVCVPCISHLSVCLPVRLLCVRPPTVRSPVGCVCAPLSTATAESDGGNAAKRRVRHRPQAQHAQVPDCGEELAALQARYRKLRADHRHVKERVQFRYRPLVNGTRLGHCEGLLDLLGKDSSGYPIPAQTCLGYDLAGIGSERRSCRFDPRHYAKWRRMPALCQYLTMGCKGSRHVFGFRDIQFSHADYLFLDFVFTGLPEVCACVCLCVCLCVRVYVFVSARVIV
jgi:hypothetical protein